MWLQFVSVAYVLVCSQALPFVVTTWPYPEATDTGQYKKGYHIFGLEQKCTCTPHCIHSAPSWLLTLVSCCKTCGTCSWLCVCHSRTIGPAMLCMPKIFLVAYRLPATFFRASSSFLSKLAMCIQSD